MLVWCGAGPDSVSAIPNNLDAGRLKNMAHFDHH